MDDLAKKLSELLSSPDGLQKLQAAAASVGMLTGNNSGASQSKPADPPAANDPQPDSVSTSLPVSDIAGIAGGDFETLSRLLPLVSGFRQENQDTLLLKALRPYLQNERRHRLDDTLKIMHLLKVLPLLRDKGVL